MVTRNTRGNGHSGVEIVEKVRQALAVVKGRSRTVIIPNPLEKIIDKSTQGLLFKIL
jgi:hypothetical protein